MRILLDESLPRPLTRLLTGHIVSTVAREGWTSLTNGALLRQAALTFDVVPTANQNIESQQNLSIYLSRQAAPAGRREPAKGVAFHRGVGRPVTNLVRYHDWHARTPRPG